MMKKLLLLFLTTFGLNAIAQTPTVNYNITSDWGTGFCATIDVIPDMAYDDWEIIIDAPGGLTSLWGANSAPLAGTQISITPSVGMVPTDKPFQVGFCGGGASTSITVVSTTFTPSGTTIVSEAMWVGDAATNSAYLNSERDYNMVGINQNVPTASLHVGTNSAVTNTSVVIETNSGDDADVNFHSGTGISTLNFKDESDNDISSLTFSKNGSGATLSFFDETTSEEVLKVVNGSVYAREVVVQTEAFPDYVFDESYNLKSLSEVEASIDSLGHLPGVPSAEKLENEGISVSELTKIQMEKIEELTLYLIQQQKEIEALKSELNNLKK